MSEMIVYCGLDCSKCDAFLATQAEDLERKKQIAQRWAQELGKEFTPEDVDCDGCLSKRISGWCQRICLIRPCAEERGVETCAHCSDYPCKKVNDFFPSEPIARQNLEEIRRSLERTD